MSMRDTNDKLTICEVLRQINDRVQGRAFDDVRDMLALAEQMAKRMALKLVEYNQNFDKEWWGKNAKYLEKCEREMNMYLAGDPARARKLLEGAGQ